MGEGLALLVERPWDPAISIISRQPLEKLPGNPVIIVAPPGTVIISRQPLEKLPGNPVIIVAPSGTVIIYRQPLEKFNPVKDVGRWRFNNKIRREFSPNQNNYLKSLKSSHTT